MCIPRSCTQAGAVAVVAAAKPICKHMAKVSAKDARQRTCLTLRLGLQEEGEVPPNG